MSGASVAHRPQNVTPRSVTEDWCKTSAGHRLCPPDLRGPHRRELFPRHARRQRHAHAALHWLAPRHRDSLHGVNGEIVACVEQRHLLAHHYGLVVALRDRRAPDDGYRDPHSLPHAGELCKHVQARRPPRVHGSGSRPARSSAHVPSRVGARGSSWEEASAARGRLSTVRALRREKCQSPVSERAY